MGFYNILEITKINKIPHLIYASTSSVYGDTNIFPTPEDASTDYPKSFYAASKKTNEILAYSYSSVHNLKTTGLRFFTVYGPFGRPDMAIYKFANAIKNNKTLKLFNKGNHFRDFTYVEDVVNLILNIILNEKVSKFQNKNYAKVFNIGNGKSEKITNIIKIMEDYFNVKSKIEFCKIQPGDVIKTHSNTSKLLKIIRRNNKTSLKKGLKEYLDWFSEYYD